jgi:hypothetical protein
MRARQMVGMAAGLMAAGVAAGAAYVFVFRPWNQRWGATDEEVYRLMPGDDELRSPRIAATRAVTIHARPEEIWPWLVQIGTGRAGWYSYDWIERLLGLKVKSAQEIMPEYQHLKAGDTIPLAPGLGIPVKAIEPQQSLFLGGYDPYTGGSTWAFMLTPLDDQRTRLIWRLRANFTWALASILGGLMAGRRDDLHHSRVDWLRELPMYLLFEPGSFVMSRKMLLGIKQRAETMAVEHRERTEIGTTAKPAAAGGASR